MESDMPTPPWRGLSDGAYYGQLPDGSQVESRADGSVVITTAGWTPEATVEVIVLRMPKDG